MKERIKELAEQAFQPINDISTEGVADRYTFEQAWFQMYNQKFAELIVRECIRCCDDIEVIQKHYLKYGINQELGAGQCIEVIKKHFGVSE